MRIHLKTTPSNDIIAFNHLHLLTGTLHKWFGRNDFHDKISLYSFSGLSGAKAMASGLVFKNGAAFFISCWDIEQTKCLVKGIQESPEMFCGLKVKEIILQEKQNLADRNYFSLGSPIFIQRNIERGGKKFYFYNDAEAGDLLTATLETKMKIAGLPTDESLKISFDLDYARKGTKKIDYKQGKHITQIKASWCPVIIKGKPETKQFAWCVGLGNSTGIGFGAIK